MAFGEKRVKLARSGVFGDNNLVLSVAYLVAAGLSFVILLSFIVGKIKAQCR